MKFFSLLTIIILLSSFTIVDHSDELSRKLCEADYYFLVITGIDNCQHCFETLLKTINCVREGVDRKFKTIFLVVCDRDVELKLFKKKHPDLKNIVRYKTEYAKKYGYSDNSMLVVLKDDLRVLRNYTYSELEEHPICQEIKETIQ